MSLPGYDLWKTTPPWDEMDDEEECPYCGAWPGQGCLLEDDCDEDEPPPCVENPPQRERDPDEALQEKRDREMEDDVPF